MSEPAERARLEVLRLTAKRRKHRLVKFNLDYPEWTRGLAGRADDSFAVKS